MVNHCSLADNGRWDKNGSQTGHALTIGTEISSPEMKNDAWYFGIVKAGRASLFHTVIMANTDTKIHYKNLIISHWSVKPISATSSHTHTEAYRYYIIVYDRQVSIICWRHSCDHHQIYPWHGANSHQIHQGDHNASLVQYILADHIHYMPVCLSACFLPIHIEKWRNNTDIIIIISTVVMKRYNNTRDVSRVAWSEWKGGWNATAPCWLKKDDTEFYPRIS